jgi:hypothetical protein
VLSAGESAVDVRAPPEAVANDRTKLLERRKMMKNLWRVLVIAGLIACMGAAGADAAKPGTSEIEGSFVTLFSAGDGFTLNTDTGNVNVYVDDATKYKGLDGLSELFAGDGLLVRGEMAGGYMYADRVELVEVTDPPMPLNMYWMTGTIEEFQAYEMVDFWYWWNETEDEWVIRYIPDPEPKFLKIMTATADSSYDEDGDGVLEWAVLAGEKYILDYGPDWYAADPCLVDSYICPCKRPEGDVCPIMIGPYLLGEFTCGSGPDSKYVQSVMSTDFNLGEEFVDLMTEAQRDALALDYAGSGAYAFGRVGGSEIVWLFECIDGTELADGCDIGEYYLLTDLYPELMGGNIVWEMELSGDRVWWRGEGAPYAKTKDLGCTVIE